MGAFCEMQSVQPQNETYHGSFLQGSNRTNSVHCLDSSSCCCLAVCAVPRLQKVIEGEQGGISKLVDWQGGGSFVYCELLEDAQSLISEIQEANHDQINLVKN